MPYSKKSRFYHKTIRKAGQFVSGTIKTVPITHTDYKGKRRPGMKARVGRLKKGGYKIQSILTPKK